MKIEVFCVKHKEYPSLHSDCIKDIQVGCDFAKKDLKILKDNSGEDNISYKNATFNELTATYWVWKNSKADAVGICHYRRFFNLSGKTHKIMFNFKNLEKLNLKASVIAGELENADVILPKKNYFGFKAYNHYKRGWYINDMQKLLESIKNKFPQIYPYAVSAMNMKRGYCYNMIIGKKQLFDEYCKFLFTVLFDIENEIKKELAGRNPYQQRVFGFLAEHLMTIFMMYKKDKYGIKIKEKPVSNCFANGLGEAASFLKREWRFYLLELFYIKRY